METVLQCIAVPLAKALGIKQVKRVQPQPNPTLEEYFKECTKKPSQSSVSNICKFWYDTNGFCNVALENQ
ncbi:UNVERIFIED_CONTAM: hypothetical protein K2H54_026566 [Gekko kuhli]